jgi:hypothetical protein
VSMKGIGTEEGDEYSQVIAIRSKHGGEETDLFDAVALPDTEGVVLEAGEEVGKLARERGVDPKLDDHNGWRCGLYEILQIVLLCKVGIK